MLRDERLFKQMIGAIGERMAVTLVAEYVETRMARAYRRRGGKYASWRAAWRALVRVRDVMRASEIGDAPDNP